VKPVIATDRITLTIPAENRFRGVATLVLGGVGSRLNLPYERVDDLQLAVLSVLEASDEDRVTVEVEAEPENIFVSVGPLDESRAADSGLARVLDPLVDAVERSAREGGVWVRLRLERTAGSS
jgi:hypothetical protein